MCREREPVQCEDFGLRLRISGDSQKQSENKMAEDNWVFDSLGTEIGRYLLVSINTSMHFQSGF